jgi:hypothetical protein
MEHAALQILPALILVIYVGRAESTRVDGGPKAFWHIA